MSGTITSSTGLVSGIDWTSMAEEIIDAQKTAAEYSLTTAQTKYEAQLTAWQSFNTLLTTITSYIEDNDLDKTAGYANYTTDLTSSSSSLTASDVLSASVDSEDVSGTGTYEIEVSALAEAEKISTGSFTSKTSELGLSGDIVINGVTITVLDSNSLLDIADAITASDAGVTASIVKVSDTEYYMELQSDETGSAGISIANGSSSDILESLTLTTGSSELANASGSDALSNTYTDSTTAVGTLLGLTDAQSGAVTINGTSVSIDLSTDSLDDIAEAINSAVGAGTASVEEVTVDGTTSYQLKLTGVAADDLTDSNNVLETLGVLQGVRTDVVNEGADATFSIDGHTITSSSNTISDAIEGVTLKLTGLTTSGNSITLEIGYDDETLEDTVSTLVDDLNAALGFITDQNTISDSTDSTSDSTDDTTDITNVLLGDSTLRSIKSTILSNIYEEVSGNTTYKTASSIGITFADDGTLEFDADTFAAALADNRKEVTAVLQNLSNNLDDSLDVFVDPYTGTITNVETYLEENITNMEERLAEMDARFERKLAVLQEKFNALEVLISDSSDTQDWLTQQIDSLSSSD